MNEIRAQVVANILTERYGKPWSIYDYENGIIALDLKRVNILWTESESDKVFNHGEKACLIVKNVGLFSVEGMELICAKDGKLFMGWHDYMEALMEYVLSFPQELPYEICDAIKSREDIIKMMKTVKRIFE